MLKVLVSVFHDIQVNARIPQKKASEWGSVLLKTFN